MQISTQNFDSQNTEQLLEKIRLLELELDVYKKDAEIKSRILEHLPISVFAKDVKNEYRYIIWNAELEKVYGKQKSEIIGRNDYDLFDNKKEADYFRHYDMSVMEGGVTIDIPVEELSTQNGKRIVHTQKVPLFSKSGEPEILFGFLVDITEQVEMKMSYNERGELFKTIMDFLPVIVSILNPDFTLKYISPSAVQLLGFTIEELNQHTLDNIHVDDKTTVMLNYKNVLQDFSRNVHKMQYRYQHKDGKFLWFETISINMMQNPYIKGILTITSDITQRKIVEQKIYNSEAQLNAMFNSSNQSYYFLNTDFMVLKFNKKASLTFSLAMDFDIVLGAYFPEIFGGKYAEILHNNCIRALEGETIQYESPFKYPNGIEVWYEHTFMPVFDSVENIIGITYVNLDITSKRNSENKIKISEEKYKNLFQKMTNGFVTLEYENSSENFKIIEINPEFSKYLQNEIKKDEIFYLKNIFSELNDVLILEKKEMSEHFKSLTLELKSNYLNKTFSVYAYSTGVNVAVMLTDISAQINANEKLEYVEQLFIDLVDSAPLGTHVYELSDNGNLIFSGYNTIADKVLGIDHSLLIGKKILEAFPGLESSNIPEIYKNIAQSGGTYHLDQIAYDDNSVVGAFDINAFQTSKNKVAVFFMDITERIKAEEKMKLLNERLVLAKKTAKIGVWDIDIVKGVIFWDDDMRLLHGIHNKSTNITREFWMSFVHHEDLQGVLDFVDKALLGVIPFEIQFRIIDTLNRTRYLKIHSTLVNNTQGQLIRIIGLCIDETMQMQSQKIIYNQLSELELKNTEMEQFAYTVSHDLRSPLITIKGFLEYILEDAKNGNITRLSGDLKRIEAASDKMMELLEDLLELSRIGRITNPYIEFDFNDLVKEVVELMHGPSLLQNIEYEIDNTMLMVFGDRFRWREVLQNLIENAIKFIGKQTKPKIKMAWDMEQKMYSISDNGIGIEPKYHDRIFGLFDKLDSHTSGTGIGLAIVKKILNHHNCKIEVESIGENCGTTFRFTLPFTNTI